MHTSMKLSLATAVLTLCSYSSASSTPDYNPAHCQAVSGTLNIFWEDVSAGHTGCTGIEFTDGTFADAADGSITLSGVSVSNTACISTGAYTFTMSPDGLTLTGMDTLLNIPMVMTRESTEGCFVGHWIWYELDYVGHISAAPFLGTVKSDHTTWGMIKALYR